VTVKVPPSQHIVRAPDPARRRRVIGAWVLVFVVSVASAWLAGGHFSNPLESQLRDRLRQVERQLAERTGQVASLQERLAVVTRADQISRGANQALQQTLADREEEVAGLKADVEFYERLVGGENRQGLRVHSLALRQIGASRGYGFSMTLTQSTSRGRELKGTLELTVTGVSAGALRTLAWSELLGDPRAAAAPFDFKYFQRIDGSILLPEGFTPSQVRVTGRSGNGDTIERTFAWNEVIKTNEDQHVRE